MVLSSVAAISKVSAIAKGYNDFSIVAVISEIGRNTIPLFRHVISNPLAGTVFVFGMSDMQFCKAQVRAVNAKTD